MKAFLLAIIIIFLLGLVSIGGLYYLNNKTANIPPKSQQDIQNYQPVTAEPTGLNFNLSSPDNNILVFKGDILVQGKSDPNSTVLISLPAEDKILDVNSEGDFSATVALADGANTIVVAAFDNAGNFKKEARVIYYSKEKI